MNLLKKLAKLYSLPILLAWFMMTIFVDIIAVPTVFRNVTRVEEAGRVGMTVFTAFNRIELIFALLFIAGAVVIFKKREKKSFLILSLTLFIWVLAYNLYFTPQIIYYTKMLHSVPMTDPMLPTYQSNHAFFHHLYRYLDTTKLLMLLTSIVLLTKFHSTEEK